MGLKEEAAKVLNAAYQVAQDIDCLGTVIDIACRKLKINRVAKSVHYGMDFGRVPAAAFPDPK